MKQFLVIVNVFVLLFTIGCAGLIQKKPLSLDKMTVTEIRHRIGQNDIKYNSMRASAEISVESPRINFAANSHILMKKPDSIFIKIKAPFGIGVGSLFIDQNQFLIYNSFENSVYTGNPQKIKLNHFFPVDLKIENIFQVFSGIHLIDNDEKDSLVIDRNKYLIIGTTGNLTKKYWIDPKKFVVTTFELLNQKNESLIKLEYKQFEKKNQVMLPKLVQVFQPGQNTRLTILYTDRKTNCRLSNKDFMMKIPDEAERIEL